MKLRQSLVLVAGAISFSGSLLAADGAKSNISASSSGARPDWFERKGQEIGLEGDTEEVGILVPIDLIGSRVLREAESAHEKLSATDETKDRPMAEFEAAHPYAVALADALEQEGAAPGKYVSVSAYRLIASEALGVSLQRNGALAAQGDEPGLS